jgi:predicted O-methyltransferase YrrM
VIISQQQFRSIFRTAPCFAGLDGGVYLTNTEREILVHLCRRACYGSEGFVLEFGCHDGATARCILKNCSGVMAYTGIDLPEGQTTILPQQKTEVPAVAGEYCNDGRFSVLLKNSLELTPADLGPIYDFIFIDGGHDYETVLHDSILALSIIRSGGVIVWHDYNDSESIGVRKVVDDINDQYQYSGRVVLVDGTWLCFLWV